MRRALVLPVFVAAMTAPAAAAAAGQDDDDEVEAVPNEPPPPPGQTPPVAPGPSAEPTHPRPPPSGQRYPVTTYSPAYETLPDQSWRRDARRGVERPSAGNIDLSHFLFELRFGPYAPRVDSDPALGGQTPYANFFGTSPKFYFGLDLDWLPLRVPYLGSFGLTAGWGTVSASGNTILEKTGQPAGSTTSLHIYPMYFGAVLRADGLLREVHFPLVPYAKLGLGLGMWKASGPNGTSIATDGTTGKGTSLGMHLAVGGALALNAFDLHSAMSLRETTGIRYAYLFGEWMMDNLNGFGSATALRVGTSTGVVGLALEF